MTVTKKDVKAVVVLIAIAVILSAILTILNFVLYVSPEERTMRAIKKMYGEEKEYSVILDANQENVDAWKDAYNYGEISLIYKVQNQNDYDLLFKSKGNYGYKGGSITCWIMVKFDGTNKSIEKIIVESFDKQTLMSKVTSGFWSNMYVDVTDAYNNKEWFFANSKDSSFKNDNPSAVLNPIGNATYSATAGCNAVNCVIACVNEFDFGGNN